ncbi:Xylose isomerase domain-containing protein TIM barrel [Methanofollis liminatans DSM 4140]|uniref:Xylose isomerase domain-containing protein TIM barrel n=1 Tax=Methanofollis liminatans DSM 4140 TaxID=28892 RepID=J1APL7_9EURY|nr:sugar phosphate isomerase/epimerase family protein [Methanofollis liminatans]EJG06833.1 Xylose isomerase domain-containing protein TIM barrel [Methanofollis liminatans DSM 4140]
MSVKPYFSSSSKVWESPEWVFGIEEADFSGWEISADGNYRLEKPANKQVICDVIESTGLAVTVHAPYADLNPASINDPIWRESVRQICSCIEHAADLTDRVTMHPGYLSPAGKLLPEKVWEQQKEALRVIGRCACDHGVVACLENMINIPEFLCHDPLELLGITEGIEGIGITFDIGHANTVRKVDGFLAQIKNASHLHIHDNHGSSDEHLALGDGTINWKKVGHAIAAGYGGEVVVIEGRSIEEAKKSLDVFRRWFV